jgi:hypothetical protein
MPLRRASLKRRRQAVPLHRLASLSWVSQYFGAGAAPPAALQDDFPPLLAGAAALPAGAAPPPALHELLPPADGLFASGAAAFPPPHATVEPISIPATADTARALAMFITLVSSLLLEERLASQRLSGGSRRGRCNARGQD